jgi:O-antigen ligase
MQRNNMFWKNLYKLLKSLTLADFAKVFLCLFFAFLPFQVKGILFSADVYGAEFFNPYMTFFVYLSDIFLALGLLILAFSIILSPQRYGKFNVGNLLLFSLILFFCFAVGVSIIFSSNTMNSFLYFLRMIEFVFVYLIIVNRIVGAELLMKVFVFSMVVAAFIGIFQYIFGHSLIFGFLGEPVLNTDMKGVAKVVFGDNIILRAYSTFSHPNIFAGYLIFAGFMSVYLFLKEKIVERKVLLVTCLLVFLLAFLLTFSRAAFLAAVSGIVFYYVVLDVKIKWKYILPILACVLLFVVVFNFSEVFMSRIDVGGDSALQEREMFLSISKNMFLKNPLGVGAGNFTSLMQDYTNVTIMPWQFQPVHNIFLLVANEIGIHGVLIFLTIFIYMFFILINRLRGGFNKPLFAILTALWSVIFIVGFFDHYFISLYQGQALMFVFFGLTGLAKKPL